MRYIFNLDKGMTNLIKRHPATIFIVLICSIIAILNLSIYGNYNEESIVILGGLDKQLINNGQIWRFFTYGFGHMSLFHFMLNIPLLLILSFPLERFYGSIKFLFIFMIISVGAGVFIYYFYEGAYPLAGSSGAGFGFFGILTFSIVKYSNKISVFDQRLIVFFLLFGLINTMSIPDIAISGHVGGFISGLILAFISSLVGGSKEKSSFYH